MRASETTRYRRPLTGRHAQPSSTCAPRLRARRGAITVLVAVLFFGMIGFLALAVDFGRLDNLRADLQTSADAAAHAGAVELVDTLGHVGTSAGAVATAYALSNRAMLSTVTVVAVECGLWADVARSFSSAPGCDFTQNAIRVTVSLQSSTLFMSAFVNFFAPSWTPPIIQARAIAAVVPDTCTPSLNNCRVYLVTEP